MPGLPSPPESSTGRATHLSAFSFRIVSRARSSSSGAESAALPPSSLVRWQHSSVSDGRLHLVGVGRTAPFRRLRLHLHLSLHQKRQTQLLFDPAPSETAPAVQSRQLHLDRQLHLVGVGRRRWLPQLHFDRQHLDGGCARCRQRSRELLAAASLRGAKAEAKAADRLLPRRHSDSSRQTTLLHSPTVRDQQCETHSEPILTVSNAVDGCKVCEVMEVNANCAIIQSL